VTVSKGKGGNVARDVVEDNLEQQFRDEDKLKKQQLALFKKLIGEGVKLLQVVQESPGLMNNENMSDFRALFFEIAGDPKQYPRQDDGAWGVSLEDLSKGAGKRLYERKLSSDGVKLVIQVTHRSNNDRQVSRIGNTDVSTKMSKFCALDGDGVQFIFRVDSTLNSAANMLTEGAIVSVGSFFTVYFTHEDSSDTRCAIVAREFRVVGHCPLSEEQKGCPKFSIKVKKPKEKKRKAEEIEVNDESVESCNCNGSLCSKHGVEFITCITKCIPIRSVSLELTARDCIFVSKTVDEMSRSEKRFLVYYYFATTIYQFRGRGNRVELPECLLKAVRASYPSIELEQVEYEEVVVTGNVDWNGSGNK